METDAKPIIIKKYANRRLYNTKTSAYVTLEDLGHMVKDGQDFVVQDAKTGEDLTRLILNQIIFEQEGKDAQGLFPISVLRQLIRFYGDQMQTLVPSYLEISMAHLAKEQEKFHQQFSRILEASTASFKPEHIFSALEQQTRQNMELFTKGLSLWPPLLRGSSSASQEEDLPSDSMEDLREKLREMQQKIERLQAEKGARKKKKE